MKAIHKYPISIANEQEIQMPLGAEILHAGLDPQNAPCIWAKVDTDNPIGLVNVHVVGTGHAIEFENGDHVGSFIQHPFVWHVFAGMP